jgi:hypothetical protein
MSESGVTQPHLMKIVAETYATGLPYPIWFASNEELVQMLIRKVYRRRLMKKSRMVLF